MPNIGRRVNRLSLLRNHRMNWYLHKLDLFFEGKCKPGDVTLRWEKTKAVKAKFRTKG